MPAIAFHFNASDKVVYACRLLRKALGSGARIVVTGDAYELARLDVALWTFAASEFLPHALLGGDAALVAHAPIVLVSEDAMASAALPHTDILVNLGGAVPEGFGRFARVIEVVSGGEDDDADRRMARDRWKHYASQGLAIERFDLRLRS